jgi:hypothetical protein
MGEIYKTPDEISCLRQGFIISNLVELIPLNYENHSIVHKEDKSNIQFEKVIHPYSIVVNQSCDLGFDHEARINNNIPDHKLLNCVLVCELFEANDIRQDKGRGMNTSEWKYVKQNKNERYYFLEGVDAKFDLAKSGLPELTADFKKYFAIDTGFIYSQIKSNIAQIRTVLTSPYLESFCSRYYNFQSRIALPEPHRSI